MITSIESRCMDLVLGYRNRNGRLAPKVAYRAYTPDQLGLTRSRRTHGADAGAMPLVRPHARRVEYSLRIGLSDYIKYFKFSEMSIEFTGHLSILWVFSVPGLMTETPSVFASTSIRVQPCKIGDSVQISHPEERDRVRPT